MPEHRARKHHQDRVAETLRLEISTMVEGELSDPRIDFCYVTEVILKPRRTVGARLRRCRQRGQGYRQGRSRTLSLAWRLPRATFALS